MDNNQILKPKALSKALFRPYGDVLEVGGEFLSINEGRCKRFNDLAQFDLEGGRAAISIFQSEIRKFPYELYLLERHPLGAQCFVPINQKRFMIIVAPDAGGVPGRPEVFISDEGQAINFHKNTWHGVLTPIEGEGVFAVIDRVGEGNNLIEYQLQTPYIISSIDV